MKKLSVVVAALVFALGSMAVMTPAEAKKSCNYTTADKAKGYRC